MNIVLNCDCMAFMRAQKDCIRLLGRRWEFKDVLAIVDPPYFDGPQMKTYYRGGKSKSHKTNYKNIKEWNVPDQEYYNQLCKVSGNQIIWGINYYQFKNTPHGRVIWDKKNSTSTFADCEIASISLIKSVKMFSYTWEGFRQENMKNKERRIHPTQKPIALYRWLLQNYARPGQLILDTHVGSGSSRIACHNLGYDFVGCELDSDCWKDQEERYQNHISQGELITGKEIQEAIWQQKTLSQ